MVDKLIHDEIDDMFHELRTFRPATLNELNIEKLQYWITDLPRQSYVDKKFEDLGEQYRAALRDANDNLPENWHEGEFELEPSRDATPSRTQVRRFIEVLDIIAEYDLVAYAAYILNRKRTKPKGPIAPLIASQNLREKDIHIRCKKGKSKLVHKVEVRPNIFKFQSIPRSEKEHVLTFATVRNRLTKCLQKLKTESKKLTFKQTGLSMTDMRPSDIRTCVSESREKIQKRLEADLQKRFLDGKTRIDTSDARVRQKMFKDMKTYIATCS